MHENAFRAYFKVSLYCMRVPVLNRQIHILKASSFRSSLTPIWQHWRIYGWSKTWSQKQRNWKLLQIRWCLNLSLDEVTESYILLYWNCWSLFEWMKTSRNHDTTTVMRVPPCIVASQKGASWLHPDLAFKLNQWKIQYLKSLYCNFVKEVNV